MIPSTQRTTQAETDLGAPGLAGLARVGRYVKSAPGATARQDWEWLGAEDDNGLLCERCEERLLRWECLNGQRTCDLCNRKHAPPEPSEESLRDARLADCGVPPVYRGCIQSAWKGGMPAAFAVFVNDPRGFWYIHGSPGHGKTHLAVAALERVQAFAQMPAWCVFHDVAETLLAAKLAMRGDGSATERLLRQLRDSFLLVLDDLGAERGTDFDQSVIADVLRHRHAMQKATIITSNLSPSQLAAIDPRLASRITTQAETHLGGKDRRTKP